MGYIDVFGCEGQDLSFDNVILVTGSNPVYDPSPLPVGSKSSRALRGTGDWRRPWVGAPTGTRYQMRFAMYMTTNNTNNDTFHVGCGRATAEHITVSCADTTGLITIRVAGAVVATAASAVINAGVFNNFIVMKVDQQVGGNIDVYTADDLVTPAVSYTLTAPDIAALVGMPDEWRVDGKASDSSSAVDDLICIDPDSGSGVVDVFTIAAASVKAQVFDGAGNAQNWLGTFADIDDIPFSDTDKISANAPTEKSDFTKPPIAEDQVFGVQMTVRTLRTGTDAGSNIRAYQREGGLEAATADQAAPAAGFNRFIFDTQRDGTAWDATAYDATTFGVEART